MTGKRFIIFFYWCFCSLAWADQLIVEPEMGRAPLLNAIKNSQQNIHLVMYGLTDQSLLTALLEQQTAHRSLKIILEQTPYRAENENNRTIQLFNQYDVPWHGRIPNMHFIHQKTLIIDGKTALIMTFNFTQSTFKNERNFALQIDDPRLVKQIEQIFSADWNHVSIQNTTPDLIYSPDDSRYKLLQLIAHARKSLKIYAQNINDYQFIGALAKAAQRGVQVQILTSSHLKEKQIAFLRRSHIQLHQLHKLYVHAKVLLIDQQQAVIGSINFTKNSLDHNRELAIMTQDKKVIQTLNQTFEMDWRHRSRTNKTHSIEQGQDAIFSRHQWQKIERHLKQLKRLLTHFIEIHT